MIENAGQDSASCSDAWAHTPAEARAVQQRLAALVRHADIGPPPQRVAGLDCSYRGDTCIAGAVVWDIDLERPVEEATARVKVDFPYVPGLLSFRELPGLLSVFRQLQTPADVLMCDGHGYAHPRRFGLACHLGVILGMPAIGCAKRVLAGTYEMPDTERHGRSLIRDGREVIGAALRTRRNVRPVFVSVGHLVTLDTACAVVARCALRHRIPEPTRRADQLVSRARKAAP